MGGIVKIGLGKAMVSAAVLGAIPNAKKQTAAVLKSNIIGRTNTRQATA
jgi:hypothetical protein